MSGGVDLSAPGISGFTNNPNFQLYSSSAIQAAQNNGIDPTLFLSLIGSESSWDPYTPSSSGAIGLAQVLPSTAANPGYGVSSFDPLDPVSSLNGSASYLSALFGKYGNWQDAIAAYKGGASNPTYQSQAQNVLLGANFTGGNDVSSGAPAMAAGSNTAGASVASSGPGASSQIFANTPSWFQTIITYLKSSIITIVILVIGLALILFAVQKAFGGNTPSIPIPAE